MCIKTLDHNFTAIGLSETHLKDKSIECYHSLGYNLEYINVAGREKSGVGLNQTMLSISYDKFYVKPIHYLNHVFLKLKIYIVI